MNIVVFSWEFVPFPGAESYCTTRFASALAQAGHNVHVVTMDHPQRMAEETVSQLLDPRVVVTRVPIVVRNKPLLARLRYRTYEWEAVNFGACIRVVRKVLKSLEKPVLISRANPLASMIVGWHCRKDAAQWISHASDPIPIPGREPDPHSPHGYCNRFWMRRSFRDADFVSVTCPNAILAFRDEYGEAAARARFVVTPHIGEPVLKIQSQAELPVEQDTIVHSGVLCGGRGGPELAAAVRELTREGHPCSFVQCGQVDDVGRLFGVDGLVRQEKAFNGAVDYVPDLQVPLPYGPFLSSKFVYRLYEDKPIVLFAHADSFSAELARRYPEAGVFWADAAEPAALKRALKAAFACTRFDRQGIRAHFTRQRIVADFCQAVGRSSGESA